jgi:uncharacterized membrane protein
MGVPAGPIRQRHDLAWKIPAWLLLLGLIAHYILRDALHYLFQFNAASFGDFWSERWIIRTHVAVAMTMVLLGPLQFWTGFRVRHRALHRAAGFGFLVSGTTAACGALYMGLHPREGGVLYGFGLFLNGLFWLMAAAMAWYAIRAGQLQVHKEWMVRTYVLTCAGFVGARVVTDMTFIGERIGTSTLFDLSSWLNWTVPLMLTEIVIQLRAMRRSARVRPGAR